MPENPLSRLLTIPPELREHIWRLILHPAANRTELPDEHVKYDYKDALVLFHINRQIYIESRKMFRDLNTIVRIETPWPEAQNHAEAEGHVPILVKGKRASDFREWALTATIDALSVQYSEGDQERFLLLADDLDSFCAHWEFSNLSYPSLNPQLRLKVKIQCPVTPKGEPKRIPRALQKKLLLPFGRIRHLSSISISGTPEPHQDIADQVLALQQQPSKTPEACLSEANRLKLEGNAELKAGHYEAALELWRQAWLSMHIVIKGRQRHVHADAFYARTLEQEPYQGKNGQSERLLLRVHLVANTCHALIQLKRYEEAAFWGMRSIVMLRNGMGTDEGIDVRPEDEAVMGFPAAVQMGKIYYRTAVAKKEMDDKDEARKLLRVAVVYLPGDEKVRETLAACSLRLG
ncbi:hypothetical protein EJ03DRAFT_134917 [Teratosphaeria nubilosa]|uniref:TPR-like protein n=1 Tax=Teratosphaeria nubilosa TaxID=161662 RepID=A0A6G1L5B0_9PEZI|nr:hypothetical protein EJ03DRAFT_134917 [Teratosphaeria nubilosa]